MARNPCSKFVEDACSRLLRLIFADQSLVLQFLDLVQPLLNRFADARRHAGSCGWCGIVIAAVEFGAQSLDDYIPIDGLGRSRTRSSC